MTKYQDRVNSFEKLKSFVPSFYGNCQTFAAATRSVAIVDDKCDSFMRLGVSVGVVHAGCIQSAVRRCLKAGCTHDEIRHVVKTAAGTLSMPQLSDVLSWIDEALTAEGAR